MDSNFGQLINSKCLGFYTHTHAHIEVAGPPLVKWQVFDYCWCINGHVSFMHQIMILVKIKIQMGAYRKNSVPKVTGF